MSGSRKGSPNKSNTFIAEIIEKTLSTQRRAELLAARAEGVLVQKEYKEGDPLIYKEAPSIEAIKELNDRQYGRPRQAIEGKIGVSFEDWLKDLPDDE